MVTTWPFVSKIFSFTYMWGWELLRLHNHVTTTIGALFKYYQYGTVHGALPRKSAKKLSKTILDN